MREFRFSRWVKMVVGILLLGAGFRCVYEAEPEIAFVHGSQARANWKNQFLIHRASGGAIALTLQVVHGSFARTLDAKFSECPLGLAGCQPARFFALQMPEDGRLALQFPAGAQDLSVQVARPLLHPLFLPFLLLWGAAFALLFSGSARAFVLWGFVLFAAYLCVNRSAPQEFDIDGHIQHVEKIAQSGPWVNANDCWECLQPPPYYVFSSALLGFPKVLLAAEVGVLRALTLLCFCLSIPLILCLVSGVARGRRDLYLYAALASFWPSGIVRSAGLGNDAPAMVLGFGCLVLLQRRRWLGAALVAVACLLVKNTGIVFLAFTALWVLWALRRQRVSARKAILCLGILGLGLAMNWAVQEKKQYDPRRLAEGLDPSLRADNGLSHLFVLDVATFLREPFVSPHEEATGRRFVENYFWKTSLFGEWRWSFPGAALLATALSVCLLALLALSLFAAFGVEQAAFPILLAGLSLLAVYGYRLAYPFFCNADFRFVYPMVVAFPLLLAQLRDRGPVIAARGIAVAFVGLTQLFFALFVTSVFQ